MHKTYEITKKCKAKYISQGLCASGCGRKLHTKTSCIYCINKHSFKRKQSKKNLRYNLIKNGFCTENCGRKLSTKWYCRKCADIKKELSKKYYRKDIVKSRKYGLQLAHKLNFNGLRDKVLKRDNYACQICDSKDKRLCVHHIDENRKNNIMSNLATLCFGCHFFVHKCVLKLKL